MIGGSALPKGLALSARRLGVKVMTGYGLSETGPVLTLGYPNGRPSGAPRRQQLLDSFAAGRAFPSHSSRSGSWTRDMKDVPRDDRTLGEIVVRSPWLTQGYYKEPEKSEALWAGGWLHTGDLAAVNERGYLVIRDRLKDVVKSGGEWISTLLLEDLLTHHPAVLEAAVIGAKDEKWGERPVAIVCLKSGKSATEEELRAHLEQFVDEGRIAKFWLPERIVVSESPLPKTSTGKLDKKPLRDMYATSSAGS